MRIEFDNRLRSRVVARFDKKETVMGPFTASETRDNRRQALDRISPDLAKTRADQRPFGEGERLTVEGKAGALTKKVTVTVYDDFPAMAFFDVQYTNTGTSSSRSKVGPTTRTR